MANTIEWFYSCGRFPLFDK